MKLMNTVITANVLCTIVLLGSSRLNLSINLYKMELSPKLNILGRWKGKHSQGGSHWKDGHTCILKMGDTWP